MAILMSLTGLLLGAAGDQPAIDPSSLRGKVLCGYQGWFRCPGDPAGQGWRHWSRESGRITVETLTFDLWPDTSELTPEERYPAPGFTTPEGKPATLFSSANRRTIDRHFDWMRDYGIDGVWLQRFLVNCGDPSFDAVLEHVRSAAARTGRIYAIAYDLTGYPTPQATQALAADWSRLVDALHVTADDRYLHHQGRPVVMVWGFFPDRFDAALAHRLIDVFGTEPRRSVTLVGGVPWWWRTVDDPEWVRAFRRFDVLSPWNVGNVVIDDGRKQAATATWQADQDEALRHGIALMPVIYPGFSWTNLMGESAADQAIPRLGGQFFWRQFVTAAELGIGMAYVAMFDEVDEGTAIFKVTNSPPRPGRFATYEGLPPDTYLRLTGAGSRLLRGERRDRAMPRLEPAGDAGPTSSE
ncbi:MAG: hypothetical protein KatS3mg108_2386 [Isosphaeraceae bacterium]|jgi:hypothetical protein|nr:MAG: hypothetical protein KatS3mg108_2386 [Isosphaeraceae bacterium]